MNKVGTCKKASATFFIFQFPHISFIISNSHLRNHFYFNEIQYILDKLFTKSVNEDFSLLQLPTNSKL